MRVLPRRLPGGAGIALACLCLGCDVRAGGQDAPAPVASSVPRAAPNARVADFPVPSTAPAPAEAEPENEPFEAPLAPAPSAPEPPSKAAGTPL